MRVLARETWQHHTGAAFEIGLALAPDAHLGAVLVDAAGVELFKMGAHVFKGAFGAMGVKAFEGRPFAFGEDHGIAGAFVPGLAAIAVLVGPGAFDGLLAGVGVEHLADAGFVAQQRGEVELPDVALVGGPPWRLLPGTTGTA